MKRITNYILFTALVLSLSSCGDFFETTLEIDPPEHIEKLVVQGFASTDEDELKVRVSKTTGILENPNDINLEINDAAVNLIHDGVSYPLNYISSNQQGAYNYILESGSIDFVEGERYTLEVEAEGFDKAIGICDVPLNVIPDDFAFEADGPTMFDEDYSEVSMVLSDPPDISNYYEFFLTLRDGFNESIYYDIYTESFDPVVEEASFSLLLKDDSFEGEDKIIELLLNRYYIENEANLDERLFLYWRTVSEDHYRYNKSIDQHIQAADNPFASPVQVYSNIENGLGIFSIYNEQYIRVF